MAIGAIARGDLVVVHAASAGGPHGLFVVDSVAGNVVTVFKPEDSTVLAGQPKTTNFVVLDKTKDILAVHTASSISA